MKFWIYYESTVVAGERLGSVWIFPNRQSIMDYVEQGKQNIKNNPLQDWHRAKVVAIQEVQIDNDIVFSLQYNHPSTWKSELFYLIMSRDPSVLLGEKTPV